MTYESIKAEADFAQLNHMYESLNVKSDARTRTAKDGPAPTGLDATDPLRLSEALAQNDQLLDALEKALEGLVGNIYPILNLATPITKPSEAVEEREASAMVLAMLARNGRLKSLIGFVCDATVRVAL